MCIRDSVSTASIVITYNTTTLFNIPEVVEGLSSGLTATTTSRVTGPKSGQFTLTVENIVANDPTFKFTVGEILRGNTSGAQADVISVEYTTFIRNEDD